MNDPTPLPNELVTLIACLAAVLVIMAMILGTIWITGGFDPPGPPQPVAICSSGPAKVIPSNNNTDDPLTIVCPDGKVYQP